MYHLLPRGLALLLPLFLAGALPLLAAFPTPDGPPTASPADLLPGLRPHPRLLATADDLARLQALAKEQPLLASELALLRQRADKALGEPTVTYSFDKGGVRLLDQSRLCLQRVLNLALMYRLSGQAKYADRAVEELSAAAAFRDWNPGHFLDVAEMSTAFAIGYDWLYDRLTPDQRDTLRGALVNKGLKPGLDAYSRAWWVKSNNNWNQVCNGGLVLGALAVADEDKQLSGSILAQALASVPRAMNSYYADGAWPEGPNYWDYATTYNVLLIAGLRSALGKDFGLTKASGLDHTGDYYAQSRGPTGLYFNYADCPERGEPACTLPWLAREFARPDLAAWHRQELAAYVAAAGQGSGAGCRFLALAILWYNDQGDATAPVALPTAAAFRGDVDVALLRSGWDKDALFVGFKAGNNAANHAHLDLGSFVLDALGTRWVSDLGSDDYHLPGYFSDQVRWHYYRLNTHSHNTLLIGDHDQLPAGRGKFIAFAKEPAKAYAVADISGGYGGVRGAGKDNARQRLASQVRRGVALLAGRQVLVQDEVSDASGPVRWAVVTAAKVSLNGATATLTRDGRELRATLLAPAGATFAVAAARPPSSDENPNKGMSQLTVTVEPVAGEYTRIAVLFTPVTERTEPPPAPALTPLADWPNVDLQPMPPLVTAGAK